MEKGKNTKPENAVFLLFQPLFCIYLESALCSMLLMMYIGNDLIEAIPLQSESIPQPGYLGQFKRLMKEKYAQLINESPMRPEFLVMSVMQQAQ